MNGTVFPPYASGCQPGFACLVPPDSPSFNGLRENYEKRLLGLQARVNWFTTLVLENPPFQNAAGQHVRALTTSLTKVEMGLNESVIALKGPEKIKKITPKVVNGLNEKLTKILSDLKEIEKPKQVSVQEGVEELLEPNLDFNQITTGLKDINEKKNIVAKTVAEDSSKLKRKIDRFKETPRPDASIEQGIILRLRNYLDGDTYVNIMQTEDKKEKKRIDHYTELKDEWNQAEIKQFEAVVLADRLEIALSVMPDVAVFASTVNQRYKETLKFKEALDAFDIKKFSEGFIPETEKRNLTKFNEIVQNKKKVLKELDEILDVITNLEDAKTELFKRVQDALTRLKDSFEKEYADELNGKVTFIESDFEIEDKLEALRNTDIDKRKKIAQNLIKDWNNLTLQFQELKGSLSLVSLFNDLKRIHCELYLEFEEIAGALRHTRKNKLKREEHQENFVKELEKFNTLSEIVSSKDLHEQILKVTFTALSSSDEATLSSDELKPDELISTQFLWLDEQGRENIETAFEKQKSFFAEKEKKNEDIITKANEEILPKICGIAVEELNFRQTTLKATVDEKGVVLKTCPADFRAAYSLKSVFRKREQVADLANTMVVKANSLVKYAGVPVKDGHDLTLDIRILSPFEKTL